MQSFGGSFHSKINLSWNWPNRRLKRRKLVLVIYRNEVHTGEVSDVCNWIQFGRYCICKDTRILN